MFQYCLWIDNYLKVTDRDYFLVNVTTGGMVVYVRYAVEYSSWTTTTTMMLMIMMMMMIDELLRIRILLFHVKQIYGCLRTKTEIDNLLVRCPKCNTRITLIAYHEVNIH